MRIHELSKKINIPSKEILSKLKELGIPAKSHMSGLESDTVDKLIYLFSKGKKTPVRDEKPALQTKEKKTAKETKPPVKAEKAESREKAKAPKKIKPAGPAPSETVDDDEVIVPDRFKKEVDTDKLTKFKSKPGMQRAFDSIRRVDVNRKGFDFKPRQKKQDKKIPVKTESIEAPSPTAPRKKILKFQEGTTVKEFSELIGQKINDVIKKFMELGYMITINQPLDADAAQIIADSYGIKIELASIESDEDFLEEADIDETALSHRPPIVTIMGHVDHGKTTLLDAIRETKVTETEAGGITQHIGAYKVTLNNKDIAFLDTPGHEAFTMMRARGAKVTDIVVLVVAADDSVMPQTIEAIDHAKAANVPIIVAVNKVDKPEANISRVKTELAQHDVVPEDWGGKNVFVEVSAKERPA